MQEKLRFWYAANKVIFIMDLLYYAIKVHKPSDST